MKRESVIIFIFLIGVFSSFAEPAERSHCGLRDSRGSGGNCWHDCRMWYRGHYYRQPCRFFPAWIWEDDDYIVIRKSVDTASDYDWDDSCQRCLYCYSWEPGYRREYESWRESQAGRDEEREVKEQLYQKRLERITIPQVNK